MKLNLLYRPRRLFSHISNVRKPSSFAPFNIWSEQCDPRVAIEYFFSVFFTNMHIHYMRVIKILRRNIIYIAIFIINMLTWSMQIIYIYTMIIVLFTYILIMTFIIIE